MATMRLIEKTLILATVALIITPSSTWAVNTLNDDVSVVKQNMASRHAREAAITPQRIDLRVEVRPNRRTVLIEADLTFIANRTTEAVRVFLRRDMNVDVIEDANGIPLSYLHRQNHLWISTPSLDPGDVTTWRFRYRFTFNASLEESGQLRLTTTWYPHFQTTPNPEEFLQSVPMLMSLTATLPDPWVLVSSGMNTAKKNKDLTTYSWRDSVPNQTIPLVIGRFVDDSKLDSIGLVRVFFEPQNKTLTKSYVEYVISVATFFSEQIGRLNRRSWNLVAVNLPEAISGLTLPGMTLLDTEAVNRNTTFPYRLLAHEIAHQWWNAYIEIPRVRDGWLREGLPTYSSLMFLEHAYGNRMMRQELERSKRVALSIVDPEPLEIGFGMSSQKAIYGLNYHKAAVVLHMLREVIGRDNFTALIRALHNLEEDVTTTVFMQQAEEIYADNLSWFFNAWLRSSEVPSFHIRYEYKRVEARLPRYELRGVIEQRDAAIRHPVRIQVSLEAAPPLETTVWIEPGSTTFNISLPSPPTGLQFDPQGNLLYRNVSIESPDPFSVAGQEKRSR